MFSVWVQPVMNIYGLSFQLKINNPGTLYSVQAED